MLTTISQSVKSEEPSIFDDNLYGSEGLNLKAFSDKGNTEYNSDTELNSVLRKRLENEKIIIEQERVNFLTMKKSFNSKMIRKCRCYNRMELPNGELLGEVFCLTQTKGGSLSLEATNRYNRYRDNMESMCNTWWKKYYQGLKRGVEIDDSEYITKLNSLNIKISQEYEAELAEIKRQNKRQNTEIINKKKHEKIRNINKINKNLRQVKETQEKLKIWCLTGNNYLLCDCKQFFHSTNSGVCVR